MLWREPQRHYAHSSSGLLASSAVCQFCKNIAFQQSPYRVEKLQLVPQTADLLVQVLYLIFFHPEKNLSMCRDKREIIQR